MLEVSARMALREFIGYVNRVETRSWLSDISSKAVMVRIEFPSDSLYVRGIEKQRFLRCDICK